MTAKRVGWSGVFTAMVTPFRSDGSLNLSGVDSHVETLVKDGVAGLVVAGSTGEFYSLTNEERLQLFQQVKRVSAGRLTLVYGTSALTLQDTIALTKSAKQIGADGCMVLPPMYCLPTGKETVAYFSKVAEIGLPIMLYNNPARTGFNVPPALAAELANIEQIVAYKESARDLYAVAETYYLTRDRWQHFAGLEPYGSALMSRGASGLVSTISNVCTREVVEYHRAYQAGDSTTVSRMETVIDKIYHLVPSSGLSTFAFVKAAMLALGRPAGVPRLPHLPADAGKVASIRSALEKIYAEANLPLPSAASKEVVPA
ncbi:MAG: dihydrodipicolinate synthase family protein [Betaproteobacteria bacterium]|nr:dihydrodipicolinate synthase family protein [Betaproteobacteria bacterium]